MNLYEEIRATLVSSLENVRLARTQSGQSVMQIVPAMRPKNQVRPIPNLYILVGSIVGLALVATAILMIDHLDVSLKSAKQIEELLGLPVLGSVFVNGHSKKILISAHDPFSAAEDAFRTLGAGVEIVGAGENIHTLMVVNAEPTNVRTTIAANLAIINARQGTKVVLLDGNIKHPHLHDLFGMEKKKGFAELLYGEENLKSACHVVKDVEGMTLIPGGDSEKFSAGWLNAEKLVQVLSQLQESADLVIVDAPPADVADTQVLASKVDAVLLVIKSGKTRIDAAESTLRRFQLIGVKVLGVVMN